MEIKKFESWEEALIFSYPNQSKSCYYKFENENLPVPAPRKRTDTIQWKVCQTEGNQNGIYLETTPTWLTVKIQKNNKAKKLDIPRKGRSINTLLAETFYK